MSEIDLNNGMKALIDDEDFAKLSTHHWFAQEGPHTFYATRSGVKMHRLIMNAPQGAIVDHINGNGLDNRKANLRLCTKTLNLANMGAVRPRKTSRFKGVSRKTGVGSWVAQIQVDSKKITLGYFDDEEDAALAYNMAASDLFGEFARLNPVSITEYRLGRKIKSYENMKRGPEGKFVEGRATA